MFVTPVVLLDFRGKFEHVFVSLRQISTHTHTHIYTQRVSASRLYWEWGCWRWRFI